VIAALIFFSALRCYKTYRVFNDTADESSHIGAGLDILQTGSYATDYVQPPLARIALALPAYWMGLRRSAQERKLSHHALWTRAPRAFYWKTLAAARAGNLIFLPFLIAYVFVWGKQLYGPVAGLAAASATSFSPNLLGHASLATVDFGAAAAIFIAAYYLWRWAQQTGARHCIAAAAACGIAVLVKFSALFFLPPLGIAFFLLAAQEQHRAGGPPQIAAMARTGALFLAVLIFVAWAGYRFETGPLPPARIQPVPGTLGQYAESAIEVGTLHGRIFLPAPTLIRGLLSVFALNARAHKAYLLGRVSSSSFPFYFLVALAVKTTLPLLLLSAIALALCVVESWTDSLSTAAYPAIAVALMLAVGAMSRINVGIRHLLPIFPFLALLAASLFADCSTSSRPGGHILAGLAWSLLAWHGVESIAAHPDYLAYFNQIARGREEHFLLDSNLDWGQDLERLRQFARQHGISTLYLSYFGRPGPDFLEIPDVRSLPAGMRPSGWVAVSKNHMGGIGRSPSDLAWLAGHTPAARVGHSILVYHFPGSHD
jgi:hypothetical protein